MRLEDELARVISAERGCSLGGTPPAPGPEAELSAFVAELPGETWHALRFLAGFIEVLEARVTDLEAAVYNEPPTS